jgi:biopolymer transport protein ExbB/TolQ
VRVKDLFLKAALAGDTWVLWLLILASVISVAVMFDRWRVYARNRGDAAGLMHGIAGFLEKHDMDGALQVAKGSQSLEGRVAAAGIENFTKGPASVEEVMTSRLLQERSLLEKNLIILGTLGNNAPFVGLFGTVLGIIKAFNDLAVTGSSGASVVMAGVSSALIATAFGILVAIPAVIANNYFRSRLKEILSNSESLSRILLAYLKAEKKR